MPFNLVYFSRVPQFHASSHMFVFPAAVELIATGPAIMGLDFPPEELFIVLMIA